MHPSSSRAFQRDQECDLKHPSSVNLKGTKQNKNKQTTFYEIYKKLNLLAMWARPKSQTKSLNYNLMAQMTPIHLFKYQMSGKVLVAHSKCWGEILGTKHPNLGGY
jgi:hypothetical protein